MNNIKELITSGSATNILLAKELCEGMELSFPRLFEEAFKEDFSLANYEDQFDCGSLVWPILKNQLHITFNLAIYSDTSAELKIKVLRPLKTPKNYTQMEGEVYYSKAFPIIFGVRQSRIEALIRYTVFEIWLSDLLRLIEQWKQPNL